MKPPLGLEGLPSPSIQRPEQIALSKRYTIIGRVGIRSQSPINRVPLHCHNQSIHGPLYVIGRTGQIDGALVSGELLNLWQSTSRLQDRLLSAVVGFADAVKP